MRPKLPEFRKYYLLVLVYIPLVVTFAILERFLTPKYTVYVFIDSYIPFIPAFSVFYFIWFIYMFIATAYFMFYSKRDFIRLTVFMASGMAICYILYIMFPNEQPLRPADTGSGVFGAIVAWLYSIDPPNNVCPSIHVVNTLGVHFSVRGSKLLAQRRLVIKLSLFICVMIILSTMFLKQHSIIDVVLGIALAFAIKFVLEGFEMRLHKTNESA